MKHSTAIRCYDFNYNNPELVVCGRNDGGISVWNIDENVMIDEISPEPTYFVNQDEKKPPAKERHHTSSITSIKLSQDKLLMATASTDNSCKIWKVASYQKSFNEVQAIAKVFYC
jgi:WD40 repeat protein